MTPTRIAILAPGLIGGSVALAATRAFPKAKIAIWTRRADSISSIQSALPKAEISTELSLISGSDLVLLAAPLRTPLPHSIRSPLSYPFHSRHRCLQHQRVSRKISRPAAQQRSPLDRLPPHGRLRRFWNPSRTPRSFPKRSRYPHPYLLHLSRNNS